jgi:hypothetical protein
MKRAGFKLIGGGVWLRGDIRIGVGDNRKLPLKNLIEYVIQNAVYVDRKNTHIKHEGFKTENK